MAEKLPESTTELENFRTFLRETMAKIMDMSDEELIDALHKATALAKDKKDD